METTDWGPYFYHGLDKRMTPIEKSCSNCKWSSQYNEYDLCPKVSRCDGHSQWAIYEPQRDHKITRTPAEFCSTCEFEKLNEHKEPCRHCNVINPGNPLARGPLENKWLRKLTPHAHAKAKLKARQAKQEAKLEAKEQARVARIARKEAKKIEKIAAKEAKQDLKRKRAYIVETVDVFTHRSMENDQQIITLKRQLSAQATRITEQDASLKEQNQRIMNQFDHFQKLTQPVDFNAEFTKWEMKKESREATPKKPQGQCDASCKHSVKNNPISCPYGDGGDRSCIRDNNNNGSKWEPYMKPSPSHPTRTDLYVEVCPTCQYGPDKRCGQRCYKTEGYQCFVLKDQVIPTPTDPIVARKEELNGNIDDMKDIDYVVAHYCR